MGLGRKDPSWLDGTPLWTLVEQQGGRASTFFWPESDASINGTLPTDYRAYDGRVPHQARVDQVIEWLSLPDTERPDLVTLYFSAVIRLAILLAQRRRRPWPPLLRSIVKLRRCGVRLNASMTSSARRSVSCWYQIMVCQRSTRRFRRCQHLASSEGIQASEWQYPGNLLSARSGGGPEWAG